MKKICTLFYLIFLLIIFVGCASMTPRYKLSDDITNTDENKSALLQIATPDNLLFFDGKETSFSVRYSFNSQAVVLHRYRETIIPTGLHFIQYRHALSYTLTDPKTGQAYTHSQDGSFLTAINFKIGHTYRIQTNPTMENGKLIFYGWVEELPFLLEPKKIKPGINFDKQFEYWYSQNWKVVGAGLIKQKVEHLYTENGLIFNLTELQALSIAGIDELKLKFPNLK